MWFVVPAFAMAPVTGDFDGDGKPETVVVAKEKLRVPPLEDVYCEEGTCELEVVDVVADKPGQELVVCQLGPRDDRSCEVLTKRAGAWSTVKFPEALGTPSWVSASGNGIVLGWYQDRWYTRLEKFTWNAGTVAHVKQPLLSTTTERHPEPWTFPVDRVFPIYDQPGGSVVVANVATGRSATLVGESPEHLYRSGWDDGKRWFLVRTQSGLTGWATLASIVAASDELVMRASAG
jgi:hypothetical protein